MQRERSLKAWDQQGSYVAKKKGYVKVCMFMRESFCLQRREQGDVWWCQQMKKGEYFFPCNRQVGCRNHYHVTSSTASFQRGLKVEKIQCSLRASRVVLRIMRSWKESQPCAVGRVEGFSTSQNPRRSLNIEGQAAQHLSAWHTCTFPEASGTDTGLGEHHGQYSLALAVCLGGDLFWPASAVSKGVGVHKWLEKAACLMATA